jgi:hypothetical protein
MKSILCLTLALLIAAPPVMGAVIYSGLQNIPIPTAFEGVYVDIDNGSTSGSAFAGWDINPFFGGAGIGNSAAFQPVRASTSNDSAVQNLLSGMLVSAASIFSTGEGGSGDIGNEHLGLAAGQFQEGVTGILGFRFTKNDSSGPFYGWIRLTLAANTPGGLVHDWAWEDSGAGIVVPEPGRAMLLLMGAWGLMLRRRRK